MPAKQITLDYIVVTILCNPVVCEVIDPSPPKNGTCRIGDSGTSPLRDSFNGFMCNFY